MTQKKGIKKLEKLKSQKVKLLIAIGLLLVVAVGVLIRYVVYQKVGEKNMPYSVSKIYVLSTASSYEKEVGKIEDGSENNNFINKDEAQAENTSSEENKVPAENAEPSGTENSKANEENSEEEANTDNEENNEENQESDEAESEESADPAKEASPAETVDVQTTSLWDFDVIQTNDIYISIDRNQANIKNDEKIKSVTIDGIRVEKMPQKGKLKPYMPNSLEGDRFKYTSDFVVRDGLTYRGAAEGNFKNLKVCENGGIVAISFANPDVGKFTSNDENEEITYNGTLLNKLGVKDEEVECTVSFDLEIELNDGKKYVGRISVDIKCDKLAEEGRSQMGITNFDDVIFKRK